MASVPARIFDAPQPTFRTTGTVTTGLRSARTGSASGGNTATTAVYAANATGVTLLNGNLANSARTTVPSAGAAATGNGWRDELHFVSGALSDAYDYPADSGNGNAYQKRYQTTITGTWTWVVSMQGAATVVATLQVIVYAISSSGTDRELFRSTAQTVGVGAVEANTTITATPGPVVLNADEIIQHEFYVNVTTGTALGFTITFRQGVAGPGLTQPSIQEGTAIVANVFQAASVSSPTTPTLQPLSARVRTLAATSVATATQGPRKVGKGIAVTSATATTLTKAITPDKIVVTSPTTATLTKRVGKGAAVTSATATTLTRRTGKLLTVTSATASSLVARLSAFRTLAVTTTTATSMGRLLRLARTLAVSSATTARGYVQVPFEKVPGGGGVTVINRIFDIFE